MSMTSPDRIELSNLQRRELTGVVRAGRSEQRLVLRARIVLHAARGHSNTMIASALGICEDTVRKWRHRWSTAPGLAALRDEKRAGRPAVFTPVQIAARPDRRGEGIGVSATGCQRPAAIALVVPRAGRPGDQRRDLRVDLAINGSPLVI
jgi:hypothetical protein